MCARLRGGEYVDDAQRRVDGLPANEFGREQVEDSQNHCRRVCDDASESRAHAVIAARSIAPAD
jgi:hypothetical protein